ncbi:MAG: diguanylate cyclase [Candidatus Edwardsbacteria bacterium]|nr:diguanylate cyclase [Candidatus Edwardsbacteria bacterium]
MLELGLGGRHRGGGLMGDPDVVRIEERLVATDGPGGDPRERFAALSELAQRLMNTEPTRALTIGEQALVVAGLLQDPGAVANGHRIVGMSHYWLGGYDKALAHATDAYELLLGAGDAAGQASSLNLMGMVNYQTGEYFTALENLTAALELRRDLGDGAGQAQCQNNLAMIHERIGDYHKALNCYLESLEIKRRVGDRQGQANSLINVAGMYQVLGRLELAREALQEGTTLFESVGDVHGQAFALINLGDLERRRQAYDEALAALARAESLLSGMGNSEARTTLLYNRAQVYKEINRPADALRELQQGLDLARQFNEPYRQAEGMIGIGQLQQQAGDADEAERTFSDALALVAGIKAYDLLMQLYQHLAALHEATGDHRRALEEYKRFHEIERQIVNRDLEARITGLTVAHDLRQARSERELYRLRNTELAELNRSLQAADQQKNELLSRLQRQAQDLELLAREDGLTGLFNRRYFDAVLASEFARARRFERDLSIVMADIDDFKAVNDRCGHQVGDLVLKRMARVLRDNCRETDWVARYGGEEFVIVLPETDGPSAVALCQRIRDQLMAEDWDGSQAGAALTISMGVADNRSAADAGAMLEAADGNLYHAKQSGRDRIVYR